MKKQMNNEAVSPVVGVMLMLVVTIIIAAVVSAFAGGMAEGTNAAPSASIEVVIDLTHGNTMGGSEITTTFEMLSGDSIPTKDLEIVTYYTYDNGTVVKTTTNKNSPLTSLGWSDTRVPFLNDMPKTGGSANAAAHFGNFTWNTGDILSTYNAAGTTALLGFDAIDLESGDVVDVKILHVPSGKYIYDKEVVAL